MDDYPENNRSTSDNPYNYSRGHSSLGSSQPCLYSVLGIDRGATPEEVKKAYRQLALRCHPDKNPDNPQAAETFKKINHAHSILSNEDKRVIYDYYGSMGLVLIENMGENVVRPVALLTHPFARCCLLFWFCATGCCCCLCCCCCCNFCCGKFAHDEQTGDKEEITISQEDSQEFPVKCQPVSVT